MRYFIRRIVFRHLAKDFIDLEVLDLIEHAKPGALLTAKAILADNQITPTPPRRHNA